MVRILLLFPARAGYVRQEKPLRQATSQAMLVGNQAVPGFQNGYLVF